jgi:site-specific recombinase XerD
MNTSQNRCWSAKTYRNHWQNLKSFFTWCELMGYVNENPVSNIPRPKLDKPLPRFIKNKDVKNILFSTDSYPWKYQLERPRNLAIISTLLFS